MKKICIGIIATNEEKILARFLPEMANGVLDIIAIDFSSTDNTKGVLNTYCKKVITKKWANDFAKAKNLLIDFATNCGYEWLFILDADENFTNTEHLKAIIEANPYELYYLPRIGFVDDTKIEASLGGFPDLQARVFSLNAGFRHRGKTHTQLYKDDAEVCVYDGKIGAVLPFFIKHYAGTKPLIEQYRRIVIRQAMTNGEAIPTEFKLPKNYELPLIKPLNLVKEL